MTRTTFRLTPGITAMLEERPPELTLEERMQAAHRRWWRQHIEILNADLWPDRTTSQGGVTSPGRMVSL